MPLYEYECVKDGRFELIRKFSDPPVEACPTCGQPVEKLLSSPAIQFKGSGWYITDYARTGTVDSKGGDSKGSDSKAGDSKAGEAKSGDSKADAKSADSKASASGSGSKSESSASSGASSSGSTSAKTS